MTKPQATKMTAVDRVAELRRKDAACHVKKLRKKLVKFHADDRAGKVSNGYVKKLSRELDISYEQRHILKNETKELSELLSAPSQDERDAWEYCHHGRKQILDAEYDRIAADTELPSIKTQLHGLHEQLAALHEQIAALDTQVKTLVTKQSVIEKDISEKICTNGLCTYDAHRRYEKLANQLAPLFQPSA